MSDQKAEPHAARRLPLAPESDYHISQAARHTCRRCAHSCTNYNVMLTETEAQRLSLEVWRPLLDNVPDNMPLVVLDNGQYLLSKKADGRCVFLDADNLCIIHREAGARVKPTACQFFPLHAIQAPDGIHISLNTGCHRLIEMGQADAPLDRGEAMRLLSDVEALTTIQAVVPLTPELTVSYQEFIGWQARLLATLETPHGTYWKNLNDAAALLFTIPAEPPASGVTWQTLFQMLERLVNQARPERRNVTALFERARRWLPALTEPGAPLAGGFDLPESAGLCAMIAHQYLEERQAALHRTARTGWVALLAAIVAGLI